MKQITLLLAMLVFTGVPATAGSTFDFVVATTNANQTFCFIVDDAQNFVIDWGDGQTNTVTLLPGISNQSHSYAVAGLYTNRVRGAATRIAFGGTGATGGIAATPALLKDIVSPLTDGITGIKSAQNMLRDATSITQFTQADWFDAASTNVTLMTGMFSGASKFDQAIGHWNVSNVTWMAEVFTGASKFNQDIGSWNVSKVGGMSWMFSGASAFDQDIGNWNVSKVTVMHGMFNGASKFNQNIGRWNVSKVTTMYSMFKQASAFNQDIGNWDVSKITSMANMFQEALKFNQDIGKWDVSNVTSMYWTFTVARAFNQDISRWNVSKVTTMESMFRLATDFKKDVSRWDVSNVVDFNRFLTSASLPTDLYNQLLIRWSRLNLKSGLTLDGGSSTYDNGLPAESRMLLTSSPFNWTITDGGSTGKLYQMPETVLSIR